MGIRLANQAGRAVLLLDGRVVDVGRRSEGRFGPDPLAALAQWDALVEWGSGLGAREDDGVLDEASLGACVPKPAKVFGVGLNYRDHAAEAKLEAPRTPLIFTKFPSCVTGPRSEVVLSGEKVDYEAELVVVIGRGGRGIREADAWDHVAGYAVGQDISDRPLQFSDKPPQFSMGKSCDSYGPVGPAIVSLDLLPSRERLRITCDVAGERLQDGNTADMIFSVPEQIAFLARTLTLEPGDLIFTGTPAGIGAVRKPPRFLVPGDLIATEIEGVGRLENPVVAG